jgi:transposase
MKENIRSEQVNDVPLLLGVMEDMGIRRLIDQTVSTHGSWQGISLGTMVEIWLSYVLTEQDHRLVAVRAWANDRRETFNRALGIELRDTDLSDDRLAIVVSVLGEDRLQRQLDAALLGEWLTVYSLPTETTRLDSTSVSVYGGGEAGSVLQQGHSKDHRPDLSQFKVMLSTLDPLGLPLACELVSGERADDGLYIPAYERMVAALGRRDVLVVGDSKMAALGTRGHLVSRGSTYLCSYRPVGGASRDWDTWLDLALAQRTEWQTVTETDERTGEIQLVAFVSTWEREQSWLDGLTHQETVWTERVLLVRSESLRNGLIRKSQQRLGKFGQALDELALPPAKGRRRYRTREDLEAKVDSLLDHYHLRGLVQVELTEQLLANRTTRWIVQAFHLDQAAWDAALDRLGWSIYLTNTTAQHYDVPSLLWTYRHQIVHERGFARLKTRRLFIRPVYLRDELRIAGLVWLLCLALRVLTLTEFRIRSELQRTQQALLGLNPAVPSQPTTRPTTERILHAFRNLTLTLFDTDARPTAFMPDLSDTQRLILSLLNLPSNLYSRLASGPPVLVHSLPES